MVSKARPPVYFIRHGETDWNRQGLIQGWTDTPLNDTGHRQARAVAQALLDVPGLSPDWNFVVSPLRRVRQTMAHVVDELHLDPQLIDIHVAVKELCFGVWWCQVLGTERPRSIGCQPWLDTGGCGGGWQFS